MTDEQATSGRRELLQRIAAAGVLASVPLIETTSAFADSGSAGCMYTYTTTARVGVVVGRDSAPPNDNDEWFQLTQNRNPAGACPCGGTAIIRYSYWVRLSSPNNSNFNIDTATNLTTLTTAKIYNGLTVDGGAPSNFNYDIQLGIYITCPGGAVRCRFQRITGTTSLSATFDASNNLGNMTLTATSAPNLAGC